MNYNSRIVREFLNTAFICENIYIKMNFYKSWYNNLDGTTFEYNKK